MIHHCHGPEAHDTTPSNVRAERLVVVGGLRCRCDVSTVFGEYSRNDFYRRRGVAGARDECIRRMVRVRSLAIGWTVHAYSLRPPSRDDLVRYLGRLCEPGGEG